MSKTVPVEDRETQWVPVPADVLLPLNTQVAYGLESGETVYRGLVEGVRLNPYPVAVHHSTTMDAWCTGWDRTARLSSLAGGSTPDKKLVLLTRQYVLTKREDEPPARLKSLDVNARLTFVHCVTDGGATVAHSGAVCRVIATAPVDKLILVRLDRRDGGDLVIPVAFARHVLADIDTSKSARFTKSRKESVVNAQ